MNVAREVRRVLAGLEPVERARVRGVRICVRRRPHRIDRQRGAGKLVAYFWGVGAERLELRTTALPDERPAVGEIVIFKGRIRPLTRDRLRVVLLHELAHALGYEEEEIVHGLGYAL